MIGSSFASWAQFQTIVADLVLQTELFGKHEVQALLELAENSGVTE